MKNHKLIISTLALLIILAAGTALGHSMRHNGRRISVGDSIADVINLFGEPQMKVELGDLETGNRSCKVQLWIYEWFPWRYELKIGRGKVLVIDKIRLRKVR